MDMTSLSGQVGILSQNTGSTVVNNYYNSGTTSSGTSSSWLDTAFSFVSSLIVRVEATFSEMVTFMKSVVFHSTVTFEDRVTFEDSDMAGTALIQNGAQSVRVDFTKPYTVIPKITVSSDAFVVYRITDKGITGFTIETQVPVTSDTSFDWIALMVQGAGTSTSTQVQHITPTPETPVQDPVTETPQTTTGTTAT